MKRLWIISSLLTAAATGVFAQSPVNLATPLNLTIPGVMKLVDANINGWTQLTFDGDRLWTPRSFYLANVSNPTQWISQIHRLGFCQPDKLWKSFPVLSVSNDSLSSGIEQVALHPNLDYSTQMAYSETVFVNGKARSVSYDFSQNGPKVDLTCSAANELGQVQSIRQVFDITNPKSFEVQQKKNGKLLSL